MTTQQYIEILKTRFKSGISREHSYRGDLETLIRNLVTGVEITNEPANVTDCGNPDYVITKGKIPIGYIEAKDIGKDLNGKQYKEQFSRYKKALDNLIITDYTWFQFYQHGELVHDIRIADIEGSKIKPIPENIEHFENLIRDFCSFISQTIKSPKKLAEMMAAKARLLQNILEAAITSDEESQENTSLKNHFDTFKKILIHDLNPSEFSDIYAQTLAYGMFAARLHDTSLDDFSRQEAAELIPQSNPFLRKLFQYIAGYDIDERIKSTVNNLADVFRATNVDAMLHNFGKSTQTEDPIIHFYETFLAEYDPTLRKARGVWYTPQPIVNFIVRAVDDILKTEFELPQGLADVSKTQIKVEVQGKKAIKEVHRVQILDPATGTATFLAETIRQIYKKFEGQQGVWSNYVENHLLPRLNGFELLMASYAMAHLKLDLLLRETGYKPTTNQRFKVFLTNSLEEYHPDTGTLFANWLSIEANEANQIKRDTPVMCVIGNPPYAVSSTNKGEWIQMLIGDYKKDLNERKINLDDDYIKFIRYGQYYIDKNGSGILAYISNNSFIDGITHRQMRKHLLKSFDKIYIIDLHGSAKKNETAMDGSKDENVFDIQQGVSINLFIKNCGKKNQKDSEVFHFELSGLREYKYQTLLDSNLNSIKWNQLVLKEPYYFFVPKNFNSESGYLKGFKLSELIPIYNNGLQTDRDNLFIDFNKDTLHERMVQLFSKSFGEDFVNQYRVKDSSSYKLLNVIESNKFDPDSIINVLYRPFDFRYIYYDPKVTSRPAQKVLKHIKGDNLAFIISRQQSTFDFQHILITNTITERCSISLQTKETGYVFPLYLYNETNGQESFGEAKERTPNLNGVLVSQISKLLGLVFTNEKEAAQDTFAPIDLFDYIYAVLNSKAYRTKYKEFCKIDFPRVPYPKDPVTFWKLVKLGEELRKIHLMESPNTERYITQYPVDGDNIVSKITAVPGNDPHLRADILRAYINETQYFDNVPELAWNFYIGGYQPAQKWLKDRKGRKLEYDDILHYQKIIVALTETDRLMREIDKVEFM
ncbi:N-6 DNA methylase [Candidatus Dojkabacteria bacterium]|nr:N-6 DNA methylase [Candidatus Dojkabacteria bacterium]